MPKLRDLDFQLLEAAGNGKENDVIRCLKNGANVNTKGYGVSSEHTVRTSIF